MEVRPETILSPPSDARIAWFEKTYRVVLPSNYVAVLKVGNGGVPVRNVFDQGRRERSIERMLCLLDVPQDDSVHGWSDITVVMSQIDARLIDDESLVGMNVIPIAALFAGDLVCLDYRKIPQSPTIAVWEHERSDEFRPYLETIAGSFAEFDGMLRPA
jgi:hypothetical protein